MKKAVNIEYSSILFILLLCLIICIGIFLRAELYIADIPFWFDEQLLGMLFYDKNIFGFFKSIDTAVKIPPLWGVLEFCFLEVFGYTFRVFRFIPFISSIISLFLFYILLKDFSKSKTAVLAGLLMFAVNSRLIYYSAEFRQYSSDVLNCLILLCLYKYISFKNIALLKSVIYSLISCIFVLISFPSVFIIPAVIFAKSIEEKYFNPKVLWIFSGIILCCIYLYLIDPECYKYMYSYWGGEREIAFWSLSFSSFLYIIEKFFSYIFPLNNGTLFIKLLFLSGLILLFKENHKDKFLFLFIFAISLFASLIRIYPFSTRHSLYLIPAVIMMIIKIIDFPAVQCSKKICRAVMFFKSVICVFIILFIINIHHLDAQLKNMDTFFQSRQERLDIKNLLGDVIDKCSEKDLFIVPGDIGVYLCFYNLYYKKNKIINIHEYPVVKKDKLPLLNDMATEHLDNNKDYEKLWFLGSFKLYTVSPEISFIETELKKRNLKYKLIEKLNIYLLEVKE